MKVKQTMAASLTSGDIPTQNIGISDDPLDQQMILNVLTNTLYTDKPGACLREYGCNGMDANVEAGKPDEPIRVRLPNKLDPTLAIRDYGHGMTQEQIVNIFCRLGRSTKRNSNEFTGMLGIGSKAGFAYGDQFMVTSFADGIKTIYSAHRDKGIPKLSKMHEEPSKEPDGIEVKIPVREQDISTFASRAERIYRYFRVRPIITGAKVEFQTRDQEFEGTGWRYIGGGSQSVAIMGNVGYTIDPIALGMKDSTTRSSWNPTPAAPMEALLHLGVELDFNIGDLEIAANREGLQYDDPTKKALQARLQVVIKEIGNMMSGKIANAPTYWDAKKMYNSLFGELRSSSFYSLQAVVSKSMVWKGKPIGSNKFDLSYDTSKPGINVRNLYRRGTAANGKIRYRTSDWISDIEATDEIGLILNDLPNQAMSPARISGFFLAAPNINHAVLFAFTTQADEDAYIKKKGLEGAPFVKLSTVTPQTCVSAGGGSYKSAHKAKHSAKAFVLDETKSDNYSSGTAKSLWWKKETVDLEDDGGLYVKIDQFKAIDSARNNVVYPHELLRIFKTLKSEKVVSGHLFGFKPDRIAKLGKKWENFFDVLGDKVKTVLANGLLQQMADFEAAEKFEPPVNIKHAGLFDSASKFRVLLEKVHEMQNPTYKGLMGLITEGSLDTWVKDIKVPKPSVNLVDILKTVHKTYPMLELVSDWQLRQAEAKELKPVIDYVRLVGK